MARLKAQGASAAGTSARPRRTATRPQQVESLGESSQDDQRKTPGRQRRGLRGAKTTENFDNTSVTADLVPKDVTSVVKTKKQRALKPLSSQQSCSSLANKADPEPRKRRNLLLSKPELKPISKTTAFKAEVSHTEHSLSNESELEMSQEAKLKEHGKEKRLLFPTKGVINTSPVKRTKSIKPGRSLSKKDDPFSSNQENDLVLSMEKVKLVENIESIDTNTQETITEQVDFPAKPLRTVMRNRRIVQDSEDESDFEVQDDSSSLEDSDQENVFVELSPEKHTSESRRSSSYSTLQDPAAHLHFSPPRNRSPVKVPVSRLSTPPAAPPSPTKRLLTSPSKKKAKIPSHEARPSIDAFWNQSEINRWNDDFSPQKTLLSPKKKPALGESRFNGLVDDDDSDDGYESPSVSPRKAKTSPTKKNREAKKAWDERKQVLAETFLQEMDAVVTDGKIAEMTESSGGVKIVWNKKLSTTAGRANWKKESRKTMQGEVVVKHTASIELAEKVIDNDDRLFNTMAHEFCHLANYIVSGIKTNPHGKEFKEWAKRCSKTFADRNVVVTTKHDYEIDYKYKWECVSCGVEYKRHSKSIDPTRHRCGSCKDKLVQTKPQPRNNGNLEYQQFVKKNYQRVKEQHPGKSMGEVMALIGEMYREEKSVETVKGKSDLQSITKAIEVIDLDD